MWCLIRVKANHGCWIADVDGDPGRTTIKENARAYRTKSFAKSQAKLLSEKYPNRSFIVEKFEL